MVLRRTVALRAAWGTATSGRLGYAASRLGYGGALRRLA
jgi:hypothetical protein